MFDNIGGKIKTLTKVLMWISISVFFIYGIVLIFDNEVLKGFLVMVVGFLGSWLSSFFLYGFGQLIENSDNLVKNTERQNLKEDYREWKNDGLITEEEEYKKWRDEGLITEEEYQRKRINY